MGELIKNLFFFFLSLAIAVISAAGLQQAYYLALFQFFHLQIPIAAFLAFGLFVFTFSRQDTALYAKSVEELAMLSIARCVTIWAFVGLIWLVK